MDSKNNPQLNYQPEVKTGELSKKEKLAFWGFVVLAVVIVYLGFKQMGNNLKTPFAIFALKYSADEAVQKTETQQMAELKIKDTDKDGLTDYDELYVYNTSPYLPDSDSDGLSDDQEVTGGTDPNCPKGQNCFSNEITSATSGQITTSTLAEPVTGLPSADQMLLQNIFSTTPDANKLREYLLQSGGSKDLINKFNDEELIAFFKEFVTATTSTLNLGVNTNLTNIPTNNVLNVGSTADLSPADIAEIRKSLIGQGISEETLKQLDDASLLNLLKQL